MASHLVAPQVITTVPRLSLAGYGTRSYPANGAYTNSGYRKPRFTLFLFAF